MKDSILILAGITIILSFVSKRAIVTIIIITILYFFYDYYKKYKKKEKKENNEIENNENDNVKNTDIPNNIEISDKKKVKYSSDIEYILKKISKYSKYNTNDYNNGLKYYNEFTDNLDTLSNENLKHSKHYIENAILYLKKSINHFQYITTNMEDSNYLDKIKYEDYKSMKKSNKLSSLIKKLYSISYSKLYDIIEIHNDKYEKNPVSYNSNININEPEAFNNINLYEMY